MKLRRRSHSWNTRDVRYERYPPWPPVGAASDPARHDGAEAVGTHREPRANGVSLPCLVTDDGPGNGFAVVYQLLDAGPLCHNRPGPAGGSDQLAVEDSARDGEPGGTEGLVAGKSEPPVGHC